MPKFSSKTDFDPFEATGIEVPKKNQREALEAAAEYLRDAMLDYIGEGKSPISGGEWTRGLTETYAKKKQKESGSKRANLELSGELLDSFFVLPSGNGLRIGVSADQADKAEGNQLGTYGQSQSTGKRREFLLQPGDDLKREIITGLKNILEEFEEDDGDN